MTPTLQPDPRRWWALGAIAFGLFMALLDVTVVNVALPSIQQSLHESYTTLEWIVNAYALVVAALLVTASRLGDMLGRKRVFGWGMVVFIMGSVFCALSPHLHVAGLSGAAVLNISRGIEAVGAAAMLPLSLSLITATFQGRERGTAFGIWGAVAGLATAIGPLVGGLLVSTIGWPSIFYLNVPTGLIGLALGWWAIQESKDTHHNGSVDGFGLVTVTVTLFCFVVALMQGNTKGWGSAEILGLFALGTVGLVAFILGELRIKNPMLDPRLFRIPSFTGSAIAAFTVSAGAYALLFYLSLYLQNYLGFSALQAGLRFLPLSGMVLVSAPLAGRWTDRVGAKWILATGMTCVVGGLAWMTRLSHATVAADWTLLLPGLLLTGIGIGLVNPPMSTLAMGTVQPRHIGMASGANNVARQTGVAFGIAVLAALLANRYHHLTRHAIMGLSSRALSHSVKVDIVSGLTKAGPIAGSLGLKAAGAKYAHSPEFPQIVAIARHAFLIGTRDVTWLGCGFVAIGWLATVLLVRHRDMVASGGTPSGRTPRPAPTSDDGATGTPKIR